MLLTVVGGHRDKGHQVKAVPAQPQELNVRVQTWPLGTRKITAAVNGYRHQRRRPQHAAASRTINNEAGLMPANSSATVCNPARARILVRPSYQISTYQVVVVRQALWLL